MSKNLLDRVRIGTPCQTDWEAMRGDERVRYCGQCEKHVYNLSQMTRQQAEALIIKTNGKLCARFERRSDGSILTTEQSLALPRLNQRFLRIASATVSAALSLSPSVAAKAPKNLPVLQQQDKKEKADNQSQEKTAKIFGTVCDGSKAVVPATSITITNSVTKESWMTKSAADATYEFPFLLAGNYSLVFEAFGFKRHLYNDVKIQEGGVLRFDVILEFGAITGDLLVLPSNIPISTDTPAENLQLNLRSKAPLPEKRIKKNLAVVLLSLFKKLKGKKS